MSEVVQEIKLNSSTSFFFMSFCFFMSHQPKIPKIQREYVEERVDYFYNYLVNYMEEYGEFYYLNPIHLAELTEQYYILDGQHRFMAYKRFYDEYCVSEGKDFKITVIYKKCENVEDFRQYFIELNDHFETKELVLELTEMDTKEILQDYVKSKYKNHISHAKSPKFPNINVDKFIDFLMGRFGRISSTSIIEKLEQTNEDMKRYLLDKDIGNYTTILNKGGLFITYIMYKKDEPENKDGRRNLPKAVKKALWETKIGMNTLVGQCYVCNTEINYHTFHCGHKRSVKNGGTDNISNLECICALCNLSMGTEDLEVFKSRYF